MKSAQRSDRVSKHRKGIEARHDLLREGIANPNNVVTAFKKGLVSQRAFASMSMPGRSIASMSLNTFKSQANLLYGSVAETGSNGFSYIDSMRVLLFGLINDKSGRRTIAGKESRAAEQIAELERKNLETMSQNAILSKALLELYGAFMNLLKSGMLDLQTAKRIDNILRDIRTLYGPTFGIARDSGPTSSGPHLKIVPDNDPEE